MVTVPHSDETERTVLGSILLDGDFASSIIERLDRDDFYTPYNVNIFESLKSLYSKNLLLDPITLEADLRSKDKLEICGGSDYIYSLTGTVTSAMNADYYLSILKDKSIKRKLISKANEILKNAYDESTDSIDVLDSAEKGIMEITFDVLSTDTTKLPVIVQSVITDVEALRNKGGGYNGIPTMFTKLDKMTSGVENSQLFIIGARPSMGKTAFALNIARNMAMQGVGVGFFSLEMKDKALVNRLLTADARVNSNLVRSGLLENKDMFRIISGAGRVSKLPIFIDDRSSIGLMALRSKARRLKKEHNIGAIMVDYLQLMTVEGFRGDIFQETAMISKGLKNLAKELDIPVIALSQLSRDNEKRSGDKRPMLSDLRNSGQIEQDADVITFLHRPEYYGVQQTETGLSTNGLAEVIVAKQRNGEVGSFYLNFIKEYGLFENLDV
jgi:replicative DNA helicase